MRAGLLLRSGDVIDIHSSTRAIEAHIAINQRKNCIIAAKADILPRQEFRAPLANNDVSGHNHFTAKSFYAQPLADAVATVLNAALPLFVCHDGS